MPRWLKTQPKNDHLDSFHLAKVKSKLHESNIELEMIQNGLPLHIINKVILPKRSASDYFFPR